MAGLNKTFRGVPSKNEFSDQVLLITTTLFVVSLAIGAQPDASQSSSSPSRPSESSKRSSFDPIGKSYGDLMLEAKRLFEAGEYDHAIQLLDFALTLEINRQQAAEATLDRGLAYSLNEETDRAIKDFDTALKLNPKLATAYHARGLALMKKNDFDNAQKDLQEAIELNPTWQFYESAARLFEEKREWSQALKNIERAIELNPKATAPYSSRAFVELRYRRYDKVIEDAGHAISLDRKNTNAYIARANAYIRLKRYEDAEKDVRSAVNADIERPAVKFNEVAWLRATCLDSKMRDGKIAVEFEARACKITNWKETRYIDTLAAAYAEIGDFDSAIKWQEQALRMVEVTPPPNISDMRARLPLYQQHQPYRDEIKP